MLRYFLPRGSKDVYQGTILLLSSAGQYPLVSTYSPADGFCGAQGWRDLGTAVRTPEHPTRRVLIPSSHDLACLVEPLAIHLDPTEPSGDMDYTFSLRRTRRLRAAMRG